MPMKRRDNARLERFDDRLLVGIVKSRSAEIAVPVEIGDLSGQLPHLETARAFLRQDTARRYSGCDEAE